MTITTGFRMLDAVLENNGPQIPDKLYFRIGEVSRLTGVKPYVLRYWETEFPMLHPKKSGTNHRLFRRKDVELLLEIKTLLYEKRFTIEGARNYIASRPKARAQKPAQAPAPPSTPAQGSLFGGPPLGALDDIRRELQEILSMLK